MKSKVVKRRAEIFGFDEDEAGKNDKNLGKEEEEEAY